MDRAYSAKIRLDNTMTITIVGTLGITFADIDHRPVPQSVWSKADTAKLCAKIALDLDADAAREMLAACKEVTP